MGIYLVRESPPQKWKKKQFLTSLIQDADNMSEDWGIAEMWLYLSCKDNTFTTYSTCKAPITSKEVGEYRQHAKAFVGPACYNFTAVSCV